MKTVQEVKMLKSEEPEFGVVIISCRFFSDPLVIWEAGTGGPPEAHWLAILEYPTMNIRDLFQTK